MKFFFHVKQGQKIGKNEMRIKNSRHMVLQNWLTRSVEQKTSIYHRQQEVTVRPLMKTLINPAEGDIM